MWGCDARVCSPKLPFPPGDLLSVFIYLFVYTLFSLVLKVDYAELVDKMDMMRHSMNIAVGIRVLEPI